jgi:hypothetical protein
MPFPDVQLKPGPKALAAAMFLAGFPDGKYFPPVTDACGVVWQKPSALHIAIAVAGGESSGNSWCWRVDDNGSTDYGVMEINTAAHPEWFGTVAPPPSLSVWNYADNAKMAYTIFHDAAPDSPQGGSFHPWMAYNGGGYKAERYGGKSWMDWAAYGLTQAWAAAGALVKLNPKWTTVQAMARVASTDNDVLEYWVHPSA